MTPLLRQTLVVPRRAPGPAPRLGAMIAAVGGCALLASCARGPAGHGFTMPPVPVEVSQVVPQMVREQFRAVGSIDADESVEIVSEINATVTRLPFIEGGAIARGALMAQLDDREASAEAARAEAQHALAKANAERAERLYADQMISQSQLDDARVALKVAEANETAARVRLEKTRVRSPFSGVVGRRRVSPGAYLRAGDVITEVARLDVMKVRFAAPERELERLGRGRKVEVTVPAVPGKSFAGTIAVVDPIIDPQTRTVEIVARVANPEQLLKPGMSGNVTVTLAEHPQALVVPDEAVFAEGTQSFVFVVQPDSSVARAAIVLGIRDSSRVEVLKGLESGASVVRTGHQKLFPGAKVMPIPASAMTETGGGS